MIVVTTYRIILAHIPILYPYCVEDVMTIDFLFYKCSGIYVFKEVVITTMTLVLAHVHMMIHNMRGI
jgi:hypothetical protein